MRLFLSQKIRSVSFKTNYGLNTTTRGPGFSTPLVSRRQHSFSKFDCDHCAKKLQIPECKACDKMVNYFKIFNIPENYRIDPQTIKDMTKDLQKEFHPDRHSEHGSDSLQQKMAKYSTYINEAKATLLNDLQRAIYLMQLKGVHIKEEIEVADSKFMLEIFEIQEQIEYADAKAAQGIKKRLQDILSDLQKDLQDFFLSKDMQKCKQFVIKYKYLHAALANAKLKITQHQQSTSAK